MDMSHTMDVVPTGSLAVVIRPTSMVRDTEVPYLEEIKHGLAHLAKRNVICYDMKIVEIGATLQALQDIQHPTPGKYPSMHTCTHTSGRKTSYMRCVCQEH
jgi:hypothetical protein